MSAYRKILVAVDGSPAATKGLREAIRLAKEERAQLVILHAVDEFYALATPEGVAPLTDLLPVLRAGGQRVLAKAKSLAAREKVKVSTVLREKVGGPAADLIVREAKRQRADLIVLGTHGRRGLRRLVLGS